MTRRRFVWSSADDCLVEVTPDYEQPSRDQARNHLISDAIYDGMKATDGTDISTRSKHREYMRRNGLTTMDDFSGEWAKAAKKRADYFQGKGGGAVTKDDIGRAIHQLESQQRRK